MFSRKKSGKSRSSLFASGAIDRALDFKRRTGQLSRGRKLGVESLEDRRMLAANLFVDFGDGLPASGIDISIGQFKDIIDGDANTGTNFSGEADPTGVLMESITTVTSQQQFSGPNSLSSVDDFYNGRLLRFVSGDAFGEEMTITDYVGASRTFVFGADFDDTLDAGDDFEIYDGTLQDADLFNISSATSIITSGFTTFRDEVMDTLQRMFEPFDINVLIRSSTAANTADFITDVNNAVGDDSATGDSDAYVFVANFQHDNESLGNAAFIRGKAASKDLNGGSNVNDEVSVVTLENFNDPDDASDVAEVIAHEAGHTFALIHRNAGVGLGPDPDPQMLDARQALLARSEVMTAGITANDIFLRYPLVRGDGNTNTADFVSIFDVLADDSNNVGLRASAPAYVTGTGAHDLIRVSDRPGTTARIEIDPFFDTARTDAIGAPLPVLAPYDVSSGNGDGVANGILVEAGQGDDQIEIELVANSNFEIRGGRGTDVLIADAGNQSMMIGANGQLMIGGTQIEVLEIEEFQITNLTDINVKGTLGDDQILVENNGGNTRITVNGLIVYDGPIDTALLIDGFAGNDRLTIDSSNGLVDINDGIRFDGGTGFDQVVIEQAGGPTHETETIAVGALPGSGRHTLADGGDTQQLNFQNIEPITTNVPALNFNVSSIVGLASLLQDDNQITYLAGSLIANSGRFEIDNFEPIEFSNKTDVTLNAGSGDDTIVANNSNLPTGLQTLTLQGDNGNDTIRFEALPDSSTTTFVSAIGIGGAGDDLIDASQIAVNTPISFTGGAGNDTLITGAGSDTFDGGAGNDALVIRGTQGNDVMDVFQVPPSAVAGTAYQLMVVNGLLAAPPAAVTKSIVSVNGGVAPNNAANLPSIERIRLEALSGDDIMRVGHDDAYSDANVNNGRAFHTIRFDVEGNAPNASDRLLVRDHLTGDLVLHRVGADQRSGSATVGGMAPVDYSGIEFLDITPLDPLTGRTGGDLNNNGVLDAGETADGRLVVFKNDPFEGNNSIANATFLGAGPTINVDPTIDPGGLAVPFPIPGDADFYQFVAAETGTLDFQLFFEPVSTLANGRAGLPGSGELTATFFDNDANPVGGIGGSGAQNITDGSGNKIGERITIPVVRNQTYFVRIAGDTNGAINVYNFTAITIAAPIPELVDLTAASDTGRNNTDNITNDRTATFNIILDDDRIDEFANIDLNPDTNNDDAQTLNDGGGNRIDYGVEVFNNAVSIGFAFYTGIDNLWQFTADELDLQEGDFNHISAAVWIRDAADPAQIGRHTLSQSLQVELDTLAPPASFGLPNVDDDGLAATSDSGVITDFATYADRITSDTTPTLWGRAEADSIVRVYFDADASGTVNAGDIQIGQTVATPLDGNNAFANGEWSLTSTLDLNQIAGVRDGLRRLLLTNQDVAGNNALNTEAGRQVDFGLFGSMAISDDAANNDFVIAVPDTGIIQDLNVELDILHPNVADLDVSLIAPDGTTVALFTDIGGATSDFIGTVLDDTAIGSIAAAVAPRTGTFTPEAGGALTDFNGLETAGNWTLRIVDDTAGNAGTLERFVLNFTTDETVLDIFIDTQGPQVNSVTIEDNAAYDLFDPKPSVDGFTPLINALNIDFIDLPNRLVAVNPGDPNFEYGALAASALDAGNYLLVGDHVGIIPIQSIDATLVGNQNGQPATQNIILNFFEPLPDDRYTLTIQDNITDPVGNKLDGESNADEPQEDPEFPSGDGVPGGDFVARFTVDSRPEIGTYVAQNINIDTNGNFVWDPATSQIGGDATNVDISFTLPVANANGTVGLGGYNVHDLVFAGRFGRGGQLLVGDDAVFVIDVSGSTTNPFASMTPVGDLNNDGNSNTILDAEIAGYLALNQELINRGLGNTSMVSLVAFSSGGNIIDVDPSIAGVQTVTTPLADNDGNGMRDIEEALRGLTSGGGTDFEQALQSAISALDMGGYANGDANVVFLSDGFGGGSFADEVTEIATTRGHNLRAFGVGTGSDIDQLRQIDPNAVQFTTADELIAAFGGGGVPGGGGPNSFDQLAAFGWSAELNSKRWIIDTNNDGVVTIGTDILTLQPAIAGFNVAAAIPVAGNFDGNAGNGDEIGLYYAGQWAFDLDRDFIIQADEVQAQGNLFGAPIVGDFDGNGVEDLAVFNSNQFFFAMNGSFNTSQTLVWGFPGVLDRPVAADMDQDGVDDIGLFVPRNSAQPDRPQAEWYFLLSGLAPGSVPTPGTISALDHAFTPVPFGNDLYAEFGDELALPIVGNFDPPVAGDGGGLVIDTNIVLDGDYNGSGTVDQGDYSLWRELYGTTDPMADGNGDGKVDSADYTVWRNNLGQTALIPGGGSGSVTQQGLSSGSSQSTAAELLASASDGASSAAFIVQATGSSQPAAAPLPVRAANSVEGSEELLLLEAAFDVLPAGHGDGGETVEIGEDSTEESADSLDAFFARLAAGV